MGRKQTKALESGLVGLQGGIALYRRGFNEFLIPHSFDRARKELEAARPDLEAMGLYEQCSHALTRSEELIKLGPEHDEEAEMLILNANRALMAATGTHKEMSRKLRERPDATYEDFKPDPDGDG